MLTPEDPRDLSRWLHRPPLHLKIDHRYHVGALARIPDTFHASLFFGNVSDPPLANAVDGLIEYSRLVWVKDFPDDGISAQTLPEIEKAFAALDVREILKRAIGEEELSVRLAETHLSVAKHRLDALRHLLPRDHT